MQIHQSKLTPSTPVQRKNNNLEPVNLEVWKFFFALLLFLLHPPLLFFFPFRKHLDFRALETLKKRPALHRVKAR